MKFFKSSLITAALVLLASCLGSCVQEEFPDNREKDFGYVQFKLYKAPQTKADVLEFLNDAKKVTVNMKFGDETIFQTLTLSASSEAAAEFGLRSQKLQLLPGKYTVTSFVLYDGMDKKLYDGFESGDFEIVAGGLQVHDLFAAAKSHGYVRFKLEKPDSYKHPETKAANREYTLDEVKTVDLVIKDKQSGIKLPPFKGLKAGFGIEFEDDDLTNEWQTSSLICDTLLFIKGGEYIIDSYTVYDSSREVLEINTKVEQDSFIVPDNDMVEATVTLTMNESPAYIKDYLALKEIWEALDGPNWFYTGENAPRGCNWNFNKDIDLWGDQVGVSLHANGRVAVVNVSDYGFKGELPAAIGQLTELVELYLGSHNDLNRFDTDFIGADAPAMDRMAAHKLYYAQLHPATPFSEPIARAMMEKGIETPEIAMYKTLPEDKIIDKATGEPIIKPMDTKPGKICNGLTAIDPAIGNLKKLEKLFIANGKLTALPESMAEMSGLTDLEIYNCPEMKEFPLVVAKMPSLISINMSNNPQWSTEEVNMGFKAICGDVAEVKKLHPSYDVTGCGASQEKIQIWYMGFNKMSVFPAAIKNLKKIGLLDMSFNQISKVEAMLGKDIHFVNLGLNNNQISDESWPANIGKDIFFGFDDLEGLTLAHNKMKTFPDLFTSDFNDAIKSLDLSFNDIQKFPENFHGLNVETLILANNPNLKVWSDVFTKSNSLMKMINLRGCGVEKIEKGAFEGSDPKVMANLVSIDLSYNHLKSLPWETMHAGNMPYLFGVDISYNSFSTFPRFLYHEFSELTVLAVRGQRDGGKRCLTEWPDGYAESNLRGLYVGSNDIRKVNDKISPLCYNLDISDNPNIVFDASDICRSIQAGAFMLIYDRTQDIRNCPILLN